VLGCLFAARFAAQQMAPGPPPSAGHDVFAASQLRNLRAALELYRREHGAYPASVEEMVEGRWITSDQTRVSGYVLRYRPPVQGVGYRLELQPDR